MTPTRRERFYEWLGLTPRSYSLALHYYVNDLEAQIKEERRRVGKLWFALAELTGGVDQRTRDRLNKRLLDPSVFEDEMDSRPVFPYGNDSRNPRP